MASSIVLPNVGIDPEKQEVQFQELQQGFSELLKELALLRSSFNDFKAEHAGINMKA